MLEPEISADIMMQVFAAARRRNWQAVIGFAQKGMIDFEMSDPSVKSHKTIRDYTRNIAFYLVRNRKIDELLHFIKHELIRPEAISRLHGRADIFKDLTTSLAFELATQGEWKKVLLLLNRGFIDIDAVDSNDNTLLDIVSYQNKGSAELAATSFLLKYNYQRFSFDEEVSDIPARTFTPSLDSTPIISDDVILDVLPKEIETSESPDSVCRCGYQ